MKQVNAGLIQLTAKSKIEVKPTHIFKIPKFVRTVRTAP
jgi:hypothetical protein